MAVFGLLLLVVSFSYQAYAGLIELDKQDYFEGDIILPTKRNAIVGDRKWPNNTIPYTIKSSFTKEQVARIEATMRTYEKHTCIRFVKRTTEKDYAVFISGNGCYSSVGQGVDGYQYISLQDFFCWSERHLFHEIGHLIGLYHEQSSKNRDEYIHVFKKNVEPKLWYNFQIENETDTYGVPYNVLSVMHYARDAFSASNLFTMYPKDGKNALNMGKTQTPHETDYEKIRRIYKCKGSYPVAPAQVLDPAPRCEDTIDYCADFKDECLTQGFAKDMCRKTCQFCGLQNGVCKDTLANCNELLDQCGVNIQTLSGCHKSCGLC